MPEFTIDEADQCPWCGKILREPPNCCEQMQSEYRKRWNKELLYKPDEGGVVQ